MKLTPSQLALLKTAADECGVQVVEYYPPAKHLVANGLCEWRKPFERAIFNRLYATERGRAELENHYPISPELERATEAFFESLRDWVE